MFEDFEVFHRIESCDLAEMITSSEQSNKLAIRFKDRVVGLAKTKLADNRITIEFGATKYNLNFRVIVYGKGTLSFCVQCPGCKAWRKRLFIRESFANDQFRATFRCLYCR